MRKKIINTKDMTIDEKKELREKLKAEYDEKLRIAKKNLPGLKERLKAKGYTLTDDFKVSKIVDGVAVWLSPVAALNVINGKPEVTQQDKNRMIWSLRKEGKLRTPFFERPGIRLLVRFFFICCGMPFLLSFGQRLFELSKDIKQGLFINTDYNKNETPEEAKKRRENERIIIQTNGRVMREEQLEREIGLYGKPRKEYLKEEINTTKNSRFRRELKAELMKNKIEDFINSISLKIETSDLWLDIIQKYDIDMIKNDFALTFSTIFLISPLYAAFLFPLSLILAPIFLCFFVGDLDNSCMTDEEKEAAQQALVLLAFFDVAIGIKEQKRREDNPIKFDD